MAQGRSETENLKVEKREGLEERQCSNHYERAYTVLKKQGHQGKSKAGPRATNTSVAQPMLSGNLCHHYKVDPVLYFVSKAKRIVIQLRKSTSYTDYNKKQKFESLKKLSCKSVYMKKFYSLSLYYRSPSTLYKLVNGTLDCINPTKMKVERDSRI